MIERYFLHSKIGEGSYGAVYKIVIKAQLDRYAVIEGMAENEAKMDEDAGEEPHEKPQPCEENKYALKIEKKMRSLQNEIKVLRELKHPQIPTLLDYGIIDGSAYMVIPLYRVSLMDIFMTTPSYFTIGHIQKIGQNLLGILDFVHGKGYVYRDMKPENIMLGYDSRIYLIDFGLCIKHDEILNPKKEKAKRKAFVGTPRYASINAHLGHQIKMKDDVESLGYVLLFLLGTILPWAGTEEKNRNVVEIGNIKMETEIENLELDKKEEWVDYFDHLKNEDEEKPDYEYLHGCLARMSSPEAAVLKQKSFLKKIYRFFCGC
ncbi:hypothetical protein ENBRE01_2704 [Enteropsectra breve]|nr:hypothetical protein ENBRE01_2704 [Enteropsectra breve]